MKKILSLCVFCVLAGVAVFPIFAASGKTSSAAMALLEESVNPTLLPSNPFYFLRAFRRVIQKTFTRDLIKRAELDLQFADEHLGEGYKLITTSPENIDSINYAIEEYAVLQASLRGRMAAIFKTGKPAETEAFAAKVANRLNHHQGLFAELTAGAIATSTEKAIVAAEKSSYETVLTIIAHRTDSAALYRLCSPTPAYTPLCGKDGETYANTCFLKLANKEAARAGRCDEDDPAEKSLGTEPVSLENSAEPASPAATTTAETIID